MKVITLSPPNALLVAHGYQTIVTREYDTPYRGWVGIYAAKDLDEAGSAVGLTFPGSDCLAEIGRPVPRGQIVGVAYLAKVERTDGITERWNRREDATRLGFPDYNDVPQWEPAFSDFTRGRMAWWLCQPVPLASYVKVKTPGVGVWDTYDASLADFVESGYGIIAKPTEKIDQYEAIVAMDLARQGIVLPDTFDPSFYRLIRRRGERDATRPRNM